VTSRDARFFIDRHAFAAVTMLTLAACGGGGGGFAGQPPGGGSNAGWQDGVFLDWSTFYARCRSPRSGIDPFTGQPYVDIQGTALDEKNFLRSFSNDVYLWYDEIVDQDPAPFTVLGYFDVLKTNAVTASGQPKDKFHFTYTTDEWYELSQSGVSAGYGAEWVFLTNFLPGQALVAYTEPDSPAVAAGTDLDRGVEVLNADGVDLAGVSNQTEFDIVIAAMYPSQVGETHDFIVRDLDGTVRPVTMTSQDASSVPVRNVKKIPTLSGDVGYLTFNSHLANSESGLVNAIDTLRAGGGVTDLIIDVRYNGGGFLAVASEFAYMIAGSVPTAGRVFEDMVFNDKHPVTNPITDQPLSPMPFYTTTQGIAGLPAGQPLPTLALPRVFVLTGPDTCSASESIINSLRGVDVDVYLIGSRTCGKPYGFYDVDNCGTTYFTIQFKGVNDKGFGEYPDGFSAENQTGIQGELVPGCSVADDFTNALGDPAEARLAAALAYRDSQTCPVASGVSQLRTTVATSGVDLSAVDGFLRQTPLERNRILRR
jgi:carboxyl-terminal processing protease